MGTILFDSIVYGPIKSRRLGMSLGINLLPTNQKVCSFECIYCECGFTKLVKGSRMPSRDEVKKELEEKLQQMKAEGLHLDVMTFAGNGEPTLHHDFEGVIDDTIALRNQYYPEAKISVLSNATMIGKESVFNALMKVDNNILKLDAGVDETARLLDQPCSPSYSVKKQIELLKKFDGNFTLQTIFLRGMVDGKVVDNTTPEEIAAWVEAVKQVHPKEVMVYQVDRETPVPGLEKLTNDELSQLAEPVRQLGIKVLVS